MNMSPLNRRRFKRFLKNRRAVVSLIIFSLMLVLSMFAELIANDKPILMVYEKKVYFPVFKTYSEKEFGGFFETEADYRDPYLTEMIEEKGFALWPPVRYSYDTIKYDTEMPPPAPPTAENPLGLDDQGRDVLARVLYGFRLSVLFGFALTIVTSVIGICAGAVQGYYGGKVDLWGQRFMEVWSGIPMLYLLILAGSIIRPGFWSLLFLMVIFGWMGLVGVVRAEFFKGRELEYVQAARVLGVSDRVIMFRHILPNALVAAMTFLPFILSGSIGVLTSLDFLGFGMPPGSPSLGELLAAGKSNLHAPWLGITAFMIVSLMLSLLVFIGEGVRDALDPRHIGR
jgi:microcin C transport system permease protein